MSTVLGPREENPRNSSCIAWDTTARHAVISIIFAVAAVKWERTALHWREYRCNTGELRVEIVCIRGVCHFWYERRLHSFVVDIIPDQIIEERVAHDLLGSRGTLPKSFFWLSN